MKLDPKLAQDIVNKMMTQIPYNVNMMDGAYASFMEWFLEPFPVKWNQHKHLLTVEDLKKMLLA